MWVLEILVDKVWWPSLDYREGFRSEGQALEEIGKIYEKHGTNVRYRAVRYAAQTK